jgi:hypothetical protein
MRHASLDFNQRGRGDRGLVRGSARSWARVTVLLASALVATGCSFLEPSSDADDTSDEYSPDPDPDVWERCPAAAEPGFTGQLGARCPIASIAVSVSDDVDGWPLNADAVEFGIPGCEKTYPCSRRSPSSFLCEVPEHALSQPSGDPQDMREVELELIGRVGGNDYRTRVGAVHADPGHPCVYDADLSLPLSHCAAQVGAAVQGRVLGVPEDAALQVSLWIPWTSDGHLSYLVTNQPCETDGPNYRCPGMGFRQEYVLEVTRDGEVIAQRDLYVRSDRCTRETLTYDVDPAACELEVWLGTDASALSDSNVTVNVEASASEPGATCARVAENRHLFRCPVSAGAADSHEVTVAVAGVEPIRVTASNAAASMCPSVQAWHTSEGVPAYGVPVVVLSNADVRALSPSEE